MVTMTRNGYNILIGKLWWIDMEKTMCGAATAQICTVRSLFACETQVANFRMNGVSWGLGVDFQYIQRCLFCIIMHFTTAIPGQILDVFTSVFAMLGLSHNVNFEL